MKRWIAVGGLLMMVAGVGRAQGDGDPIRQWDESVNALLRKVSPSVVQILVTG